MYFSDGNRRLNFVFLDYSFDSFWLCPIRIGVIQWPKKSFNICLALCNIAITVFHNWWYIMPMKTYQNITFLIGNLQSSQKKLNSIFKPIVRLAHLKTISESEKMCCLKYTKKCHVLPQKETELSYTATYAHYEKAKIHLPTFH